MSLITKNEFEEKIKNGVLKIAFVGMSNAGKSYYSEKLQNEMDFFWYDIDEKIQGVLGFGNMDEISDWLGYPNSLDYTQREKKYLELENKFTKTVDVDTNKKNLVFDTTGSVIYLDNNTLNWLKNNTLIVNFDVGENAILGMLEKFFDNPKPLMWNGEFNQQKNETTNNALKRCYPQLLKKRLKLYKQLAHISIPIEKIKDKSAEELLEIIKKELK